MAFSVVQGDFYTHIEEEQAGLNCLAVSQHAAGGPTSPDEVQGGCLTLRHPLRWNREVRRGDAEDERVLLSWRLFMMQYLTRFVAALRKDWLERKRKERSAEGRVEESRWCCKQRNCWQAAGNRHDGDKGLGHEGGGRRQSNEKDLQGNGGPSEEEKWWDDADERFLRTYDEVEIPYSHSDFNTEHKRTVARIEACEQTCFRYLPVPPFVITVRPMGTFVTCALLAMSPCRPSRQSTDRSVEESRQHYVNPAQIEIRGLPSAPADVYTWSLH